jgi:hypothetical protein
MNSLTPIQVHEQVNLIQHVMKEVMKENQHYGKIPGCGDKPTLLKAGAEKLGMTFRLAPRFEITRHDLPGGHREYEVKSILTHIDSGLTIGEGLGCCSTMETKYRYRNAKRKCPACGAEAIIQTKKGRNPGGYWCVPDKGGCNTNFDPGDPAVENQDLGKVENPDIADTYNTVLKMAKKRAQVDAILTATAASDIFSQDLEDFYPDEPAPRQVQSREVDHPHEAPPASGEMTADEIFLAELADAFDGYGFDADAAKRAKDAIRKKYKVAALASLTTEKRREAIDAVISGKLDKYRTPAPEMASA